MNGSMIFAMFNLNEVSAQYGVLDLDEIGALQVLTITNCQQGGPVANDIDRLRRRLGCTLAKARKLVSALISQGVAVETEDGIITVLAQHALEKFRVRSEQGSTAARTRWDRDKKRSVPQSPPSRDPEARAKVVPLPRKGAYDHPLDDLIRDIHKVASEAGESRLADRIGLAEEQEHCALWLEAGKSPEDVLAAVAPVLRKPHQAPIHSLKYFDRAVGYCVRDAG